MEIAGYQSDIKVTNIFNQDKFHSEKSIAEFGVTTGTKLNTYELSLTPKLTKPYEQGLRLQVVFHKTNTGAITLNVDGKGAVTVQKLVPICTKANGGVSGQPSTEQNGTNPIVSPVTTGTKPEGFKLVPLEKGDLTLGVHYLLVYDGDTFQMINHLPQCAPKNSSIPTPPVNEPLLNRQEYFEIQPNQIDDFIFLAPGRNRYAAINGNLIVARDIRIKRTGGPGKLSRALIKLPKPLDPNAAEAPGALQSLEGETFYYGMNKDGILRIQGELKGVNDEVNVNFYPYIAKYPLEWDTETKFSQDIDGIDPPAAKTVARKTTSSKAKAKPKTTK